MTDSGRLQPDLGFALVPKQSTCTERLVVHTTTTWLRAHPHLLFESHLAKVLTLVVVLDRKQAIES
jgi:hypothetical protein